MPTPKLSAARSIAKALRPSEDTIDNSIAATADLVGSIIRARLSAGVAPSVGHEAYMLAAKTLAALSEARDHVVNCHGRLDQVRADEGIGPGQAGCTPFKTEGREQQAPLRVVNG